MRRFCMFAAALALGGCSFLKSIVGADTVSLENAKVDSMSVDIRKKQKTICPRAPVQMAVFIEANLEGEEKKQSFETWSGTGMVNKNDKLSFDDFAFHSEQGDFDEDGWFQPNPDLLATIDREFELTTAFKRRPDKFTFDTSYKPEYSCIEGAVAQAAGGPSGSGGDRGKSGDSGRSGSSTQAGGDGSAGGQGGPGSNGGAGAGGQAIRGYVTKVRTKFYDELIAIKLTGAVDDFLLLPARKKMTIVSMGGPGGSGGPGGGGGDGGSGASGNPGGSGGEGGPGGNGGNGGPGGVGGSIQLVIDAAFPDLADRFQLEAPGGPGGSAGPAGSGGRGGFSGSGNGQGAQSGQQGNGGAAGAEGGSGQVGAPGQTSVEPGDVRSHFDSMAGIELLSDAAGE